MSARPPAQVSQVQSQVGAKAEPNSPEHLQSRAPSAIAKEPRRASQLCFRSGREEHEARERQQEETQRLPESSEEARSQHLKPLLRLCQLQALYWQSQLLLEVPRLHLHMLLRRLLLALPSLLHHCMLLSPVELHLLRLPPCTLLPMPRLLLPQCRLLPMPHLSLSANPPFAVLHLLQ